LRAKRPGFVSRCDARLIGEVIRDLGGGRLSKDSVINHAVGADCIAKPGNEVQDGSILARIHAADAALAREALVRIAAAFTISSAPPAPQPLVAEILQ